MIITKKCRNCGKTYEYCNSFRGTSIFRWQDVACSPECGYIYFKQILESRGQDASVLNLQGIKQESKYEYDPMLDDEDEDDDFYEDEFDDDYDDEDEEDF